MIEILKNLCQVKGGAVEMKLLSIPVGVSDFEEIRRNGYYYVDKSGESQVCHIADTSIS